MAVQLLVVDDSLTQVLKLQFILEEHGFAVEVARDGRQALEAVQRKRPDLIISDIVMPEMDGYEMCRIIKSDEHWQRVPVILLTTLADPRDILMGLQAQADAYLTKPYDEKVLVTRVNTLLEQAATGQMPSAAEHCRITGEFLPREADGLEVYFEGEQHIVTAGRRQMLNLLLSTYENAVRQNRILTETQRELRALNEQLQRQNERIERSEANYRALLNDKTDAVLVVDNLGSVRFVNPAGEEMLGKSDADLWGLPFPYRFELGQTSEVEIAAPQPGVDEDGLLAEMHAVATEWGGEAAALVTLRDITARKHYERRIHEQQLALQSANGRLQEANERLEALATLDGLTGIFNHRAAKERLNAEWARSRRYGTELSVIMLDVDKFKQYNDTFGHPAGDEVLKTVARILRETGRESDSMARYGGEEFVAILPNTSREAAQIFAERLRVALESQPWTLRLVTGSFGTATMTAQMSGPDDLIAAADKALYYSKEHGRNRVTQAEDI